MAIAIVAATAVFGVGVWYSQTYAWYVELTDETVFMTRYDGVTEPLPVAAFEGIDAETSPLRYRACFTTDLSLPTLSETYQAYAPAVPLNAPGWFSCFQAEQIGAAVEAGEALAFLGQQNRPYGFDIVVAIDAAGQGYAWPQINPCGEASFGGDPLPPGCPVAPERTE
ncbi:MAG: DUF6446 family protein [Pseudomonadota bacterium]